MKVLISRMAGPAGNNGGSGTRRVQPANRVETTRGELPRPMIGPPLPRLRRRSNEARPRAGVHTGYAVQWIAHEGRMAQVTIDPRRVIDAYLRAGSRPYRRRDLLPPI